MFSCYVVDYYVGPNHLIREYLIVFLYYYVSICGNITSNVWYIRHMHTVIMTCKWCVVFHKKTYLRCSCSYNISVYAKVYTTSLYTNCYEGIFVEKLMLFIKSRNNDCKIVIVIYIFVFLPFLEFM